jgi:hypothetical protein
MPDYIGFYKAHTSSIGCTPRILPVGSRSHHHVGRRQGPSSQPLRRRSFFFFRGSDLQDFRTTWTVKQTHTHIHTQTHTQIDICLFVCICAYGLPKNGTGYLFSYVSKIGIIQPLLFYWQWRSPKTGASPSKSQSVDDVWVRHFKKQTAEEQRSWLPHSTFILLKPPCVT